MGHATDDMDLNSALREWVDHLDKVHLDIAKTHVALHQMLNTLLWARLGGQPSSEFRHLNFMQSAELALVGHHRATALLSRLRLLDAARNELSHSFDLTKFMTKLERFMRAATADDQYILPVTLEDRFAQTSRATHDLLFDILAVVSLGQKAAAHKAGV